MSINYCTLSNSSVDTFCGGRRAVVLNRLLAELEQQRQQPPSVPGAGGISPRFPIPQRQDRWEPPIINPPTELERIVVSVTFQDMYGEAFQDVDNRLDLVTVTNIEIEPTTVSVNISDLKVN